METGDLLVLGSGSRFEVVDEKRRNRRELTDLISSVWEFETTDIPMSDSRR